MWPPLGNITVWCLNCLQTTSIDKISLCRYSLDVVMLGVFHRGCRYHNGLDYHEQYKAINLLNRNVDRSAVNQTTISDKTCWDKATFLVLQLLKQTFCLKAALFLPPKLYLDFSWSEMYWRTYDNTQQHWLRGEGSGIGRVSRGV